MKSINNREENCFNCQHCFNSSEYGLNYKCSKTGKQVDNTDACSEYEKLKEC